MIWWLLCAAVQAAPAKEPHNGRYTSGTGLPSQKACLDILGLSGPGKAQALAEVCAGLCLAGELSIGGAFCSGDFARAHQLLARAKAR